jgi:hypothetical protein
LAVQKHFCTILNGASTLINGCAVFVKVPIERAKKRRLKVQSCGGPDPTYSKRICHCSI